MPSRPPEPSDVLLAGQRALVTGASRGIGRAVTEELASRGTRVAIHCRRSRPEVDSFAASLPGGPHPVVPGDLADPGSVRGIAADAIEALGGLDLLVNNAGIFELHPPLGSPPVDWDEIWDRTLAVNLAAPARLCHAAARHMASHGGGKIVNVSSRGAFRGEPEAPAYGASKAGLNALSQSLAKALAPHGIMVYAVAPGWVATDMAAPYLEGPEGEEIESQSPLGRAADPTEIARLVAFLAGEGTDYLTGCIIDANGASYLR